MPLHPLKTFCSYAHEDEDIMDELRTHLSSLRLRKLIDDWHDRKIPPGGDWDKEIRLQLESADLILLLISADFIASDYCMGVETAYALERGKQGKATVIPVFARECIIDGLSFAYLQGTPKDCGWITQQTNSDKAYAEVVQTVSDAVALIAGANKSADTVAVAEDLITTPITVKPHAKPWFLISAVIFLLALAGVVGYLYLKPKPVHAWDSLLLQGEYKAAQELCKSELNENTLAEPVQLCLSVSDLMLNKPYSTEAFYSQADALLKRYPDSAYALAIMGEATAAQKEQGRLQKAVDYYQQALTLNTEFAQAHFGLGQVYELQHKSDKALLSYENAITLAPENRRYRQNLASLYSIKGDYEKAEQQLKELLAIDQSSVLSRIDYVSVLQNLGRFDEAFVQSKDLIAYIRTDPEIWESPLNKAAWFFIVTKAGEESVYIESQQDKVMYTQLAYVLSALLAGNESDAEAMLKRLNTLSFGENVARLLKSDCDRLRQIHSQKNIVNILDRFLTALGLTQQK